MEPPPPPPARPPSPALKRATSDTRTLPLDLFNDASNFQSERQEQAAETLQQWCHKLAKYKRIQAKHEQTEFVEHLKHLVQGFERVTGLSFAEASYELSDPAFLDSAKHVLSCWPKDELLFSLPRDSRSPRAFISVAMIAHHTANVLNDDPDEDQLSTVPRQLLIASSRLMLSSLESLLTAITTQSGHTFCCNLFIFSRRFLAAALTTYRQVDSEKLAASIVAPYSQTYAMLVVAQKSGDADVETSAIVQLAKMKQAMVTLIGSDRTAQTLSEVEASVASTVTDKMKEEEAKEKERKQNEEFTERLMSNMSVTNERLCHEIILNPKYQIPGSSQEEETKTGAEDPEPGEHPQVAHMKMIEDKMKKVFWDGLTTSLTPPAQATDADFVLDAVVQCRYGAEGSYYLAKIVKCHEAKGANLDRTFDVQFQDDTVIQTGVSISMFKKAGDPISYDKLLALLDEVRQKLLGIAPKRGGFVEQINANIDVELLKQILENGRGFDIPSFQKLTAFVCHLITEFQAPVRNLKTRQWIQQYLGKVTTITTTPIALLPELLEWVFARCDETAKDIANSHIEMLRPQLLTNGVEYERKAFKRRLDGKVLTLHNTKQLMKETVAYVQEQKINSGVNKETVLDKCVRREQAGFISFVASSFVCLLRRGVRLDTPGYESLDGGLPETLLWDAAKFAKVRDVLDTVTLISTMVVLLRQVLARNGCMGTEEVWVKVQRELLVLVESGGVRMPDLIAYIEGKARELAQLNDGEVESLKNIIGNAAKAENAVFKLYAKRCDKLVFDALKVGIRKEVWGKEGERMKELVVGGGFSVFEAELTACLVNLASVFKHTVSVHNEYYTELSIEAIQENVAQENVARENVA